MNKTKIEWTEKTWNPMVGCTKKTAGCANCYAETMARRLKAAGTKGYENGFELTLMPERLEQPLKEHKSTMFFVNSMSDLFHEDVPFEYIDEVLSVMRRTPQHIYQVLTKREEEMYKYFQTRTAPENLWMGVTVENQECKKRIDYLREVDASVRFISFEPLLDYLGTLDLSGIHWAIVGGESGVKARPMKEAWAQNINTQCIEQKVPFFFKQWGTWGADNIRRSKKANGSSLNGRTWKEFPQVRELAAI